jgi:hypothetical protein
MLRRYVEFDGQPQPVEVRKIAGDVGQVLIRDEIEQLASNGDAERWGAWEYELRAPWSEGLLLRVEANLEGWADRAKDASRVEASASIRARRSELLEGCDYRMMPDYPGEGKEQWEAYRQALRDITGQAGFPYDVTWPERPAS